MYHLRVSTGLDVPTVSAYSVGMKGLQYTIRSVPSHVDKALRQRARRMGQSLNEVVLDALATATGAAVADAEPRGDLDWFIGSKTMDSSFDSALTWLDSLPQETE